MARPEKVAVVEEIKEKLESAEAVFITEYRGLTVGQQQELRRSLTRADAEYKVFKMSLARRAAEESGLDDLLVWLEGPTAIAFSTGDPVPAAKSLKEFSDSNDSLVIKGGLLAGATLDAAEVRRLADIEPRDVLLAKLAGAMSAPMSKLAGLIQAMLRQPVTAMQQLLEKKEQEEPPAASPESPAEEASEAGSETDEPAEDAPPAEEATAEAEEPSDEPVAEAEEVADEPAADAEATADEEPAAEKEELAAEVEEAGTETEAEEPATGEDVSDDSEDK